MKKLGYLFLPLAFLAGCSNLKQATNSTNETNQSPETVVTTEEKTEVVSAPDASVTKETETKESANESSTLESTTELEKQNDTNMDNSVEKEAEANINETAKNLSGSWASSDYYVEFKPDGSYTLQRLPNNPPTQGQYTVMNVEEDLILLKLSNFSYKTAPMENYLLARVNQNQLRLGYFAEFTRQSTDGLLSGNFPTAAINFNQSLIGSWHLLNPPTEFQVYYNYNPDGTMEIFSDGRGEMVTGNYDAVYEGNQVTLTTNWEGRSNTEVYTIENGIYYQTNNPDVKFIRNTIPQPF